MKKNTLIVILAALLCALCLVSCGKKEATATENVDNSLTYIKEKGNFILGLDDSFPPMGYRDENNEIVGFDVDVAKEVCKRLGVELILQPIDWDAKEQELATKQIDCIWNGFTMTEERKKNMTFSIPYVNNAQVVVVRADSKFKTLADLSGKIVGLQGGSSAADAVEDTASFKSSIKEIIEFNDNLTALMDLEAKGVDCVVMDLLVANDAIAKRGGNFRILDESLSPEEYAIGFRLGENALANAVNEQLQAMAKDGSLAEIATKWFGADITTVAK